MNARPLILLACLSLWVLAAAAACSTPGPKPHPAERALSQSKASVHASIDEGVDESESIDEYVVRARLNPCRCEAPDHEIYIHGRWTRVFLEARESLLTQIDEQLNRNGSGAGFESLELVGAIDGQESTSQGLSYQIFEVVDLIDPS